MPGGRLKKSIEQIDTLQDLPDEAEEITTQLLEARLPVIRVAVFRRRRGNGPQERRPWRARRPAHPAEGMGEVLIDGVRDYEVRVDVRQDALLEHGLSLPAGGRRDPRVDDRGARRDGQGLRAT